MSTLIAMTQNLEADEVIRKIRRLSVVLDTSVKEMEKDFAEPKNGKEQSEEQLRITMDYRFILIQLQQQKALQDDRRSRLSQVSQRRHRKVGEDAPATNGDHRELEEGDADEQRRKNKLRNCSEFCYKCNIKVSLEDITTYALCRGCDQTVCRSKLCSDWDRTTGYWECLTCINNRDGQVRAGEWILDQLNRRFKRSAAVASGENHGSSSARDETVASHRDMETQSEQSFPESTYSISIEQKAKVREFLEEIISEMVGGPLDEVPVTQLHPESEYLPVWDHECPGVSHLKLKRLIQKIMAEAMRLPDLFNQSGVPPPPNARTPTEEQMPFFDPKKYEQLVATAVLNKVIESYRNPDNAFVENSSGVHTGSETDNGKSELGRRRRPFRLDDDDEDEDEQPDTESTDLNEYVLKHRVPLPDFSTIDSGESTADEMSSSRSTTGTEGTWEENWLFKKKKLRAETSGSLGMLVPSPTEEVKALIGDKNADEVSDLSEAEDVGDSDGDEEERHEVRGLKELPSVLIQSKTLIGGKNELISFDDHSSGGDSLVSNPDSGINVTDARNDALVDEEFSRSVLERAEREAEQEPVEAINETKIVPVAAPRKISRDDSAKVFSAAATVVVNQISEEDVTTAPESVVEVIPEKEEEETKVAEVVAVAPAEDVQPDEQSVVPGSLAEREHLKWLNATAEIPNNPYSPEALEKRLQGSMSSIGISLGSPSLEPASIVSQGNSENERDVGEEEVVQQEEKVARTMQEVLSGDVAANADVDKNDYKRYGRDYYINDARRASGSRKKAAAAEAASSPAAAPRTEQSTIVSEEIPPRKSVIEDEIFLAKPIIVEDRSIDSRDGYSLERAEEEPEYEEVSSSSSPNTSSNPPVSLSLSEDSDTARIYDLHTMETRFEKRTPNPGPTALSPDTVKFFAPKTVPKFSNRVTETAEPKLSGATLVPIGDNNITNVDLINRLVIEDDVLPVLPSVKKLASAFASIDSAADRNLAPIQRPKSVLVESPSSTPVESNAVKEEVVVEVAPKVKTSPRLVSIKKDANLHLFRPGYSITGRSLSKKFREELKQSTNATEENNNEADCVDRNGIEGAAAEGRISPERSPSPVLVPGRLKDNIAFYENLRRH